MSGSPPQQSVALQYYDICYMYIILPAIFNKEAASPKVKPDSILALPLSLQNCGSMDEHLWQLRDDFEGLNSYEAIRWAFKNFAHTSLEVPPKKLLATPLKSIARILYM